MKSVNNQKQGFTLVEIIIVIGIILVIAGIGIGAYGNARRGIAVDLESDKIIATLHSLRSESQSVTRCVGIVFKKNQTPRRIESAYLNAVDGCDAISESRPLILDENIVVSALTLDGGQRSEFSVLFAPPLGTMRFIPSAGEGLLTISTKAGSASARTIALNSQTGKIEKK